MNNGTLSAAVVAGRADPAVDIDLAAGWVALSAAALGPPFSQHNGIIARDLIARLATRLRPALPRLQGPVKTSLSAVGRDGL